MTRRAAVVASGVLVAAAAWLFVTRVSGTMPDLDVYLRAGARAMAAEPLYRSEDSHYQFKYLPAFAVLMVPLGAAGVPVARALWFTASLLLLVVLLAGSVRLAAAAGQDGLPRGRPAWLLTAVAVTALGKFYARELLLGQVNIFAAVVVVAALLALKRGREAMAGSLVALAIVLKPYFVLLVPWLVARRRPRSILAVTAGIAAALALPAAVYGVAGAAALHRDWWRTVRDTTAPNVLNPDNVSWMAMYTRWFGDASGAWPTTLLVLTIAGAIGVLAWVWAHRGALEFPEGLEGALLLVLMPFLSPQGWDYVLLVATPAVVYIAAYDNRVPSRLRWMTIAALALVGLTIYDVIGRTAYHAFMNASGITWCFVVVIAALVTLRLRRVA